MYSKKILVCLIGNLFFQISGASGAVLNLQRPDGKSTHLLVPVQQMRISPNVTKGAGGSSGGGSGQNAPAPNPSAPAPNQPAVPIFPNPEFTRPGREISGGRGSNGTHDAFGTGSNSGRNPPSSGGGGSVGGGGGSMSEGSGSSGGSIKVPQYEPSNPNQYSDSPPPYDSGKSNFDQGTPRSTTLDSLNSLGLLSMETEAIRSEVNELYNQIYREAEQVARQLSPAAGQTKIVQEHINQTLSAMGLPPQGALPQELSGRINSLNQRFVAANPETAQGRQAQSLGQALTQEASLSLNNGDLEEAQIFAQMAESLLPLALDLAIGFSPLGTPRDIFEFISGKNMLTGKNLDDSERLIAGLGILTFGTISSIHKFSKIVKTVEKINPGVERITVTLIEVASDMDPRTVAKVERWTGELVDKLGLSQHLSRGKNLESYANSWISEGKVYRAISQRDIVAYQIGNEGFLGSWLMRENPIEIFEKYGLEKGERILRDKYVIPVGNMFDEVRKVSIPKDTEFFIGAAGANGWKNADGTLLSGGGIQMSIPRPIDKEWILKRTKLEDLK